ncbi:MAG TPA: ATP-binding cassette domain-containing protein [Acidimicrobiales bacterium]|nr:ATP-binding cassette domain-containing protein [Acidimicrobiales bacterium]
MSKFLSLLVTGVVTGAIYSMLAAGLTLTYSTTGIFNLGYGAVAFTSAFIFYELQTGLHWPVVWAAVVVILVFAPLLGLLLDRFVFRKLSQASEGSKIMATVGVLIAVPALAQWVVALLIGVGHANIPDGSLISLAPGLGPQPPHHWQFGSVLNLDSDQLIVAIVAAVMAIGLWYLLRHTALGLRMRALVDRPDLAAARGVDGGRTSAVAWVLGTVMAGLAGVAGAPIFNSLSSATYLYVLLVATAAAVLGGLRSVPLAALGGLFIGAVQSLVAGYATFAQSISGFSDAVPFVLLLIGLIVWGRERARRAGQVADDVPPPDYLALRPRWRRIAPWIFWFTALVVYIYFGADSYWLGLATKGLALSLVFLSFTIVTGTGGSVSLAQAAFVTASGLMAGVLISQYHQPYLVGLLGGVAFAVLLGVIVAVPALRLGGLALALATLALGFVGDNVLFQWARLAGPSQQGWVIPRPSWGPIHFSSNKSLAVLLVVTVILVTVLIRNLQRSSSGRMMSAVRTSQSAAETSGISGTTVKITLFAVSAGLAGLGGVLVVTVDQHVTASTYTTPVGLVWLATVVLFGIRRPSGAIAAAMTSVLLAGVLSSGFHFSFVSWSGTTSVFFPAVLFGLGAVTMAQNPDGILSLTEEQSFRRRQRRLAKQQAAATGGGTARIRLDGRTPAPTVTGGSRPPRGIPTLAPARGEVALRVEALSAGYGETQVLFDIDLDVHAGKLTALVGANGAGKSTLCKVVAGLMPPTGGAVFLDGKDVTGQPAHQRAKRLLLAPESRGVFPSLSVEDNLKLLLPEVSDQEKAFDRFPILKERRRLPAGSLSGGEQQMLTMAPMLVKPPRVLVADEPTLGLAPLIVEEIIRVFGELRDQGVTLLIVEERAKAVLDIADEVALLELGRLVWAGPRVELDPDQLAAIYLGQSHLETAPARI